jgi:hypothetical protein
VLHELAEVLKSKKIYESSLIVYNTILESAPTDIHAIAKKAQVQYAMGEIENGLYGMQQVLIFDSTIEPYSTIFTPILSVCPVIVLLVPFNLYLMHITTSRLIERSRSTK